MIEMYLYGVFQYLNTCFLASIHFPKHLLSYCIRKVLVDAIFLQMNIIFFSNFLSSFNNTILPSIFVHHFVCFKVDECDNYYSQSIFLLSSLFSMMVYGKIRDTNLVGVNHRYCVFVFFLKLQRLFLMFQQ